jgi:hypothetical protein
MRSAQLLQRSILRISLHQDPKISTGRRAPTELMTSWNRKTSTAASCSSSSRTRKQQSSFIPQYGQRYHVARMTTSSSDEPLQQNHAPADGNDLLSNYAVAPLFQVLFICQHVKLEDYTRPCPSFYNATVGGHVRHILDHYSKLAAGLHGSSTRKSTSSETVRVVRYDVRQRNTSVETDKEAATSSCHQIMGTLHESGCINKFSDPSTEVAPRAIHQGAVNVEFMNEKGQSFLIPSSSARELAFVAHHAIHHLSTIRLMLQSMHCNLDLGNMGLAPSTMQFNTTRR